MTMGIAAIPRHLRSTARSGVAFVGHALLVALAGVCYAAGYVTGSVLRLVLWCVASFIAGFQVARR